MQRGPAVLGEVQISEAPRAVPVQGGWPAHAQPCPGRAQASLTPLRVRPALCPGKARGAQPGVLTCPRPGYQCSSSTAGVPAPSLASFLGQCCGRCLRTQWQCHQVPELTFPTEVDNGGNGQVDRGGCSGGVQQAAETGLGEDVGLWVLGEGVPEKGTGEAGMGTAGWRPGVAGPW